MPLKLRLAGQIHDVLVTGRERALSVQADGTSHTVALADGLTIDGVSRSVMAVRTPTSLHIDADGETWVVDDLPLGRAAEREAASADTVTAPMPGLVVELAVAQGDQVDKGQTLLVIEAMKMQLELKAPIAGLVAELRVAKGQQVPARALLARIAPEEETP